jgi:hypothetical protein
MVQQLRSREPRYSCTVSIAAFTGVPEEEILTFGETEDAAQQEAEMMLAKRGCTPDQIAELMQQAQIEAIGQWCARE